MDVPSEIPADIQEPGQDFPSPQDIEMVVEMASRAQVNIRTFFEKLEELTKVTDVQLGILELIGKHEEISQSTLAKQLNLNKATISGHVEKLLENNLVLLEECPQDGRKKNLVLTDAGHKVYDIITFLRNKLIERILTLIGPETFAWIKMFYQKLDADLDAKFHAFAGFIEDLKDTFETQDYMEIPLDEFREKLSQIFPFLFDATERPKDEDG